MRYNEVSLDDLTAHGISVWNSMLDFVPPNPLQVEPNPLIKNKTKEDQGAAIDQAHEIETGQLIPVSEDIELSSKMNTVIPNSMEQSSRFPGETILAFCDRVPAVSICHLQRFEAIRLKRQQLGKLWLNGFFCQDKANTHGEYREYAVNSRYSSTGLTQYWRKKTLIRGSLEQFRSEFRKLCTPNSNPRVEEICNQYQTKG